MQRSPTPVADLGIAAFLIVICGNLLWESRKLPPGSFEPLGSAAVPRCIAGVMLLLSLIVVARAILQLRHGMRVPAEDPTLVLRPYAAAATFLLTLVYVLVLSLDVLGFAVATSVYLTLLIWGLARFERRTLPWAILVALVMGFGCEYLFTRVFVVDLPSGH